MDIPTICMQILRKVYPWFDSSKSSEYAATDAPTFTESGIENGNILLQCNDKMCAARTLATFFSCVGHKLFHVLGIVQL